jgi:hypothetical protein
MRSRSSEFVEIIKSTERGVLYLAGFVAVLAFVAAGVYIGFAATGIPGWESASLSILVCTVIFLLPFLALALGRSQTAHAERDRERARADDATRELAIAKGESEKLAGENARLERELGEIRDKFADEVRVRERVERELEAERTSTQRAGMIPLVNPDVRYEHHLFHADKYFLTLRNLGAGPAEDVKVRASYNSGGNRVDVDSAAFIPVFPPRASQEVLLGDSTQIGPSPAISVTVDYRDVFGRQYTKSVVVRFG